MESRVSKRTYAAFGLMLAVGVLPVFASAQDVGTVRSGTATQVGFPLCPPDQHCPGGKGQVRLDGTFPCPADLDFTQCELVINMIMSDPANGELVHAERCMVDQGGGPLMIPARRGSKPNDAIFEVDQSLRPTCRIQFKNRGKGVCEFSSGLKIDRAVIDAPSGSPVVLETAFDLVGVGCGASVPTFDAHASWAERLPAGSGNWRAPRP